MKFIYLIVFFGLMASCKPEPMELAMPQAPQKLVVASQYAGEGIMGLALSKSYSALQKPIQSNPEGIYVDTSLLVGSAKITLSGAGVRLPIEEFYQGFYGSASTFLLDGETYTLEVKTENMGEVSARAIKMKKVEFAEVSWTALPSSMETQLDYTLQDHPEQGNYYVVNYFLPGNQNALPAKPKPEDIAKRLIEQQATFDLFSEADFTNGRLSISKKINRQNQGDSLLVSCSNISKEYFDFLTAQKKAGNLFNQLRGEVVTLKGNIHGGYGFFSLHEPDVRVLTLP